MALTLSETFDIIAPHLASSSRKDDYLDFAETELDSGAWGALYERAASNLAAHLLTMAPSDGVGVEQAGQITSKSAGELSQTTNGLSAATSLGDQALAQTAYGVEFMRLRNSRYVRAPRVINPGY